MTHVEQQFSALKLADAAPAENEKCVLVDIPGVDLSPLSPAAMRTILKVFSVLHTVVDEVLTRIDTDLTLPEPTWLRQALILLIRTRGLLLPGDAPL